MKNLTRNQPNEQKTNYINVIIDKLNMHYFYFILIILHDSQLFIFTILVFVQALHFDFNVVINNSFHFIFETVLLLDSIN